MQYHINLVKYAKIFNKYLYLSWNEFVLNQILIMQLPKKCVKYRALVSFFYHNIYYIHYFILFRKETHQMVYKNWQYVKPMLIYL